MTLTELQKTQINNSNAAMQRAQVGTLLGNLESGAAGILRKITRQLPIVLLQTGAVLLVLLLLLKVLFPLAQLFCFLL